MSKLRPLLKSHYIELILMIKLCRHHGNIENNPEQGTYSVLYNKAFKTKLLEASIAEKQKGCNMTMMSTTQINNAPYRGSSGLHKGVVVY